MGMKLKINEAHCLKITSKCNCTNGDGVLWTCGLKMVQRSGLCKEDVL